MTKTDGSYRGFRVVLGFRFSMLLVLVQKSEIVSRPENHNHTCQIQVFSIGSSSRVGGQET